MPLIGDDILQVRTHTRLARIWSLRELTPKTPRARLLLGCALAG